MTSIQVNYLKALEERRHNLAIEQLNRDEIVVERQKLAETITNNLRNYKVNVSKNTIQRLADQELNAREKAKLSESIRSNMVNETLKMQQNLETQRSNLSNEEIKRMTNEITNNNNLINALKAVGGSPETALINWLTGLLGVAGVHGSSTVSTFMTNLIAPGAQAPTTTSKYEDSQVGASKARASANAQVDYANSSPRRRKLEKDEISTDHSQSYGPGYTQYPTGTKQNTVYRPTQQYDQPIGPMPTRNVAVGNLVPQSPAVVTDKASSGSKVIVSPGAKINVGPGYGPGVF